MMWNHWKIFDKMTEDLNYDLFGGPKWPGNWVSGANIQHTSKISSNWHVHQDWCETSGKCLRKWPKTGILTYLGAQSGPKIGPLRTIFSTHIKVLGMSMWSNTVGKPVRTFEKVTKHQKFVLIWGSKWPRNWAFKRHIFYKSLTVAPMRI